MQLCWWCVYLRISTCRIPLFVIYEYILQTKANRRVCELPCLLPLCKTVAVKPVKMATLVGRPPVTVGHSFTEPVRWHYTRSWFHNLTTCLSWILATVSHFLHPILGDLKVYNFLYHTKVYNFCITLYMGRNPHSLAGLPYVHPTSVFSPHVRTVHWRFLMVTDTLQYVKSYSLTGLCTLLDSRLPSRCRWDLPSSVTLHSV